MNARLVRDAQLRAILWMVLNCFMAASIVAIVKYTALDFSLSVLISSYNLIATIIIAGLVLYFRHSIKTQHIFLHFLRSLLSIIAYFMYFNALSLTSIANVVAIAYTDAILTCIFSRIILKESLTKIDMLNLSLSFIGAAMIIKPDANILNVGGLLAASSAILWSLSNLVIKVVSKRDSNITQLFYSNLFTFLLAMVVVVFEGTTAELQATFYHPWFILLALMSCIQYFALFTSLGTARAGVVMPFFVVGVIFAHIYGYAFFGEAQGAMEFIGTSLIILVSIFQIVRVKKQDQI